MGWIALRMLVGDRTKYLGIIFGIAFATLLMGQQISIFMGIMTRTASQVLDVRDAPIWVMDRETRFIDEAPPLPAGDLHRVRSVPGVDSAVRLYKGQLNARLADGKFRAHILLGLDDSSLTGAPAKMVAGSLEDLRKPDAVLIDTAGHEYLFPGKSWQIGTVFEINERRAVLVGVCEASAPFTTLPIVYTRFTNALTYNPGHRNVMNYILVQPAEGEDIPALCQRIQDQTGRAAMTRDQFFWKTIGYFLGSTGIPVNFGITIALGFIVGVAVAGLTFYLFTIENLKQFGALKAMGVDNLRLVFMILLQGSVVGLIGYSIGIGLTAAFFESTAHVTHLRGLHLHWPVMAGVGVAVMFIVLLASLISIRKVLVLEPAIVFRG